VQVEQKWRKITLLLTSFFHLTCVNQAHNAHITNKKHFNVFHVFYSLNSHQHVSATIAAIFSMMLLLQEYKVQMCLAVSPS